MRVRPAVRADAAAWAAIAVAALGDKYRPAFGRRSEDAAAAIMRAAIDAGTGIAHRLAEVDGRPAGVVRLIPGPGGRHPSVLPALADAVGWARALRAVAVLSLLAPPPVDAGTLYVDELAVAPWARRRGVARALLAEADRMARAMGAGRMSLMVTADNAPARALYAATGWREEGRRRWRVRRLLFGAPGALVMERRPGPG